MVVGLGRQGSEARKRGGDDAEAAAKIYKLYRFCNTLQNGSSAHFVLSFKTQNTSPESERETTLSIIHYIFQHM